MDFDKSRVYTALNADELKIGSEVIVADTLHLLKEMVQSNYETSILEKIYCDDCGCRFGTGGSIGFALAYLVSEPEEKVLKWTDLNLLDIIEKDGARRVVINIIPDDEDGYHIIAGGCPMCNEDLKEWRKED